MNMLSWMLEDSFATGLTLTLLHFLWQGCFIGVLVVIGGAVLRKASARTRCTVNVAAMLLMAACLPVTFFLIVSPKFVPNRPIAFVPENGIPSLPPQGPEESSQPFEEMIPAHAEVNGAAESAVEQNQPPIAVNPPIAAPATGPVFSFGAIASTFSALSRWICLLYLSGVAFILGRLLLGVWGGHRLRKMAIAITDEALLASFRRLAHRVGLKAAPAIAWCEQISIPVVVGIFKPMILLPMALASSLTPGQLQALMLHELSHIRRFDPVINLLQRIVEALLFFHPVVWFVSRRISFEREMAADDMVLAAGWKKPLYADALVRVAEITSTISPSSSLRRAAILGATGARNSDFKHRVLRLLGESQTPKLDLLRSAPMTAILLLSMGGVFAWSQSAAPKAPKPESEAVQQQSKTDIAAHQPIANQQSEPDSEPFNAYMKIMDFAPMSECQAAIKRLDDAEVRKLAAQCRERLAQRWKAISKQPVLTFLREIPETEKELEGGDRIGIQTELDGVWSTGKGNADNWREWILRKQNDYRVGRLQLLFEAAQAYRKLDDSVSAKRALIAGLTGHEIFDADLKTLIEKHWPVKNEDPAKALGFTPAASAPQAWTLVNFLDELVAAQSTLGELDQAITTQSRLTLAHFILSWKDPSAGPAQNARKLWSLIRQKPVAPPSLFWFNVLSEESPSKTFDLSTVGQRNEPLTFHHQNVAAAPALDFAELKVSAKTKGRKGLLECYHINREGKHTALGMLKPTAEGEAEQTIESTLKLPAGTGLVQFLVAGEDFQVGEVNVTATFTKRPESEFKTGHLSSASKTPQGVTILRKPSLLLPDHWIMNAVAFDNDDQQLITVSNQSFATIRRWDLAEMKLISEIKLHGDVHGRPFREGTFVFSGDRKKVVAATDLYVGIWDTSSGVLLSKMLFPLKFSIYDCAIDKLDCNEDLSVIVGHWGMPGRLTRTYDAHVMVWDGRTGVTMQTIVDKGATHLKAVDLSADGKLLATTNGNGVSIWEVSSGKNLLRAENDNSARLPKEEKEKSPFISNVWSIQFSPDGKLLAVGDTLGVKLLDVTTGTMVQELAGPYRYSSGASPPLIFSRDGKQLARLGAASEEGGEKADYSIPIWSTETGEKRRELHTSANDAVFSADGKRLAVGFSDLQQAVAVWNLESSTTDPEKTEGPGPHSRQDRIEENGHYVGAVAAEYVEKFKPIWGEAKLGIQYGIAITKPQREFKIGERVPLVVFFRNASDKPLRLDTQPDCYGNAPKLLDAKGAAITFENLPLLGHIPHYYEELKPGEVFGPLYLSFGLGENPAPGRRHWHPYLKEPTAGKYSLAHSISANVGGPAKEDAKTATELSSGVIEFEIIVGEKATSQGDVNKATSTTGSPAGATRDDAKRLTLEQDPLAKYGDDLVVSWVHNGDHRTAQSSSLRVVILKDGTVIAGGDSNRNRECQIALTPSQLESALKELAEEDRCFELTADGQYFIKPGEPYNGWDRSADWFYIRRGDKEVHVGCIYGWPSGEADRIPGAVTTFKIMDRLGKIISLARAGGMTEIERVLPTANAALKQAFPTLAPLSARDFSSSERFLYPARSIYFAKPIEADRAYGVELELRDDGRITPISAWYGKDTRDLVKPPVIRGLDLAKFPVSREWKDIEKLRVKTIRGFENNPEYEYYDLEDDATLCYLPKQNQFYIEVGNNQLRGKLYGPIDGDPAKVLTPPPAPEKKAKAEAKPGSTQGASTAVSAPKQDPALIAAVRGLDLSQIQMLPHEEALKKTPELHVQDPKDPASWSRPKNVFPMPLGEHTWLMYPAGSGHFFVEHRPDGTWQSEVQYGPIAGDPFEVLKLDAFFREQFSDDTKFISDPMYRLTLMLRTGEPDLIKRCWRYCLPMLSRTLKTRNEPGLFTRLEVLERVREGLRDEAEAFTNPELADTLKQIREIMGAMETSIDKLNDSTPDEEYNSATYLQAKIEAKLPDALWGKPVDGLRLGLVPVSARPTGADWDALPADASLPTSIQVELGEEVNYLLLVENVSDQEIKFCGYVGSEEVGRAIVILDQNGKEVRYNSLHTSIPPHRSYWRLKPGEKKLLTLPAIYFHKDEEGQSPSQLGYHVPATSSKYTVQCSVYFGDLDTSRHRYVPGKSEWIGMLTTGAQAINITTAPGKQGGAQESAKSSEPKAPPTAKPPIDKHLEPFQGTWAFDICDSALKGYGASQQESQRWRWTVKGDQITWYRQGEAWSLKLNVDPQKSPPEFDLTYLSGPFEGKKCLGTFNWGGIDGKSLQIAIQDPGAKADRPKQIEMSSTSQSGLIFLRQTEPIDPEKEIAAFQGEWIFSNVMTNSWPKPIGKKDDQVNERRWTVDKNVISWTGVDGEVVKMSFTIDPHQVPRQIDFTFLSGPHKGQTCQGVYQDLGTSESWICLADPGSKAERPKDIHFNSTEPYTWISLEPVKPKTDKKEGAAPKGGVPEPR